MKKNRSNIPAAKKKTLFEKIGRLIDGIDEAVYNAGELAITFPSTTLALLIAVNSDLNKLEYVYGPMSGQMANIREGIHHLNNRMFN